MRHAFDAFVAHFGRNLLNHCSFVHLIRDLFDDNSPTVFAQLFKAGFGPVDNAATTFKISFTRAGAAQHDAPCREVRTGDIFDQLF